MKKKLFTIVLGAMVVLGSAGNALAAEAEADTAAQKEALQNLNWKNVTAYIFQVNGWKPGTWENITIPGWTKPETGNKPETGTKPEEGTKPETGNKPEEGTKPETGTQQAGQKAQVVSLVNKERAAAGLKSLTSDSQIAAVAQKKAEDMAKNGYFSHTSPTYGSAFDMLKAAGISYRSAGENIAKGQKTAQVVMNGWMNSSGHRANILSSSYTKIGVGYAVDAKGTPYWVQIFAG